MRSPLGQRVRTNNLVERLNRKMRHFRGALLLASTAGGGAFHRLGHRSDVAATLAPNADDLSSVLADASTVTTDAKEPMTPDLTQFLEEVAA